MRDSRSSQASSSPTFLFSILTHNSIHDLDAIATPPGIYSQGLFTSHQDPEFLFTEAHHIYSPARILDTPPLIPSSKAEDPDATALYPCSAKDGLTQMLEPLATVPSAQASAGTDLDPIAAKHMLLEQRLHSVNDDWIEAAIKTLSDIVHEPQDIPSAARDAIIRQFGPDRYTELTKAPLFLFLNVVYKGLWMEEIMPSFPKMPMQEEQTQRSINSIETIYGVVLNTLTSPATREQLAMRTGFQRRRLSSAMMPLRAVGLIAEPENLKRNHPSNERAVCEHDGGPHLILCRNVRQEAASFAISGFCRYYRQLQLIRKHLEKTVGLVRYDNSFIDERLTLLTQPHPGVRENSLDHDSRAGWC